MLKFKIFGSDPFETVQVIYSGNFPLPFAKRCLDVLKSAKTCVSLDNQQKSVLFYTYLKQNWILNYQNEHTIFAGK